MHFSLSPPIEVYSSDSQNPAVSLLWSLRGVFEGRLSESCLGSVEEVGCLRWVLLWFGAIKLNWIDQIKPQIGWNYKPLQECEAEELRQTQTNLKLPQMEITTFLLCWVQPAIKCLAGLQLFLTESRSIDTGIVPKWFILFPGKHLIFIQLHF